MMDNRPSNHASNRLIIVPRWAGKSDSDFYPWLLEKLKTEHPGRFDEVRALDLPRPELPEVGVWPAAIAAALGSDRETLARTYILAHSVGCQALIRCLGELAPAVQVAGVLAVAGWWELDQPWDSIRPWLAPVDTLNRARAAAKKWTVLLSDNDPFTSGWQRNRQLWEERLGAHCRLAPGGRHFNAPAEPEVLAALLSLSE